MSTAECLMRCSIFKIIIFLFYTNIFISLGPLKILGRGLNINYFSCSIASDARRIKILKMLFLEEKKIVLKVSHRIGGPPRFGGPRRAPSAPMPKRASGWDLKSI